MHRHLPRYSAVRDGYEQATADTTTTADHYGKDPQATDGGYAAVLALGSLTGRGRACAQAPTREARR